MAMKRSWRQEAVDRLNAMCGVDEHGAILPPPPGMGIDRTAWSWWRNPAAQENATAPPSESKEVS